MLCCFVLFFVEVQYKSLSKNYDTNRENNSVVVFPLHIGKFKFFFRKNSFEVIFSFLLRKLVVYLL